MKFNNKIFWVMIVVLASGILAYTLLDSHLINLAKNNKRYYTQGLEFAKEKDYQNAYYNFGAVEQGSEYYCPALYHAALSAKNLYDKQSATKMYNDVIQHCSGTIFDEKAKYNLAKLYFEQSQYKKAKSLFLDLSKFAQNEQFKIASNYFLAEISNKCNTPNSKQAKVYYLKYLKDAPNGKYAAASILGLLNLKSSTDTTEKEIIAKALYMDGNYDAARNLFYEIPVEKSWYYLAMCERKLGNYKLTKELLERGFAEYTDFVDKETLQDAIDVYSLYAPTKQTGYLNAANILTEIHLAGGDYALYKYILESKRDTRAPYYQQIIDLYPDGDFASDAFWNLMYLQYKSKNYATVVKMSEEHEKKYPNTLAAPRALFFGAKAAQKLKLVANEKNTLKRLIEKYPDSYYAFRANQLLHGRKTAWTIKNKKEIIEKKKDISFPFDYCKLSQKDSDTLKLLENAGDLELLEDLLGENLIVKSWVNYKEGNKALSAVQARDFISKLNVKPDFSDDIYRLAYPLYYTDDVNKSAQRYNLDPFIIISIIKEESHFDPKARSYVGASGLMQLMPDTASFIAQKYNLTYSRQFLNNPTTNIALGAAYLDYALNELQKKYLFAVAGYNGGHNAVKNWHGTLNYADYDEFVEEIPYEETQTYIRKVFKSYWNYVNVYDTIE